MVVLFDEKETNSKVKELPYIQDPANYEQNVVERFKPNTFIAFCQTFIDDSSQGFYETNSLLEIRESLYRPFSTIFHVGTKVTLLLRVPEYEDIFE